MDERNPVDTIYTDFVKAIHSIQHNVFLRELPKYGFQLNPVDLLHSYLSNRAVTAYSGMTQGSNFGLVPVFFINDISEGTTSRCLL